MQGAAGWTCVPSAICGTEHLMPLEITKLTQSLLFIRVGTLIILSLAGLNIADGGLSSPPPHIPQ